MNKENKQKTKKEMLERQQELLNYTKEVYAARMGGASVSVTHFDNCKVSMMENVGEISEDNEYYKNLFNEIFKERQLKTMSYFMTLTEESTVKFFRKNFDVLYEAKVPIGYDGKFQWHMCIANPYDYRWKHEEYAEREEGIEFKRMTAKQMNKFRKEAQSKE